MAFSQSGGAPKHQTPASQRGGGLLTQQALGVDSKTAQRAKTLEDLSLNPGEDEGGS